MNKSNTDILIDVGVNADESTQFLNNWAEGMSKKLKETFDLDMSPEKILKKLQIVSVEVDKISRKISSMTGGIKVDSGRTVGFQQDVYKSSMSGEYVVDIEGGQYSQTRNSIKASSAYMRSVDLLISKKKELDELQRKSTGTDAEIKKMALLSSEIESLNRGYERQRENLSEYQTYDVESTFNKAQYKFADYETNKGLLDEKQARLDASKLQAQQKKELADYEAREKEILKNKQIAWRLEEQASANRFKNSESSRRAQAQANQKVAELIGLNKQARAGAAGDEQHLKNMKGLTNEYNQNAEKTHNIIRAQYAQNKNFFTDMMAGWKDATARIINYTVIYRSLWAGIKGVQAGIQAIAELNKQFTDIQMVTGATNQQIKEMSKNYADLASQLGVTTSMVAEGEIYALFKFL